MLLAMYGCLFNMGGTLLSGGELLCLWEVSDVCILGGGVVFDRSLNAVVFVIDVLLHCLASWLLVTHLSGLGVDAAVVLQGSALLLELGSLVCFLRNQCYLLAFEGGVLLVAALD